MLALLAPGQGSQKPGFLTPWLTGWDGAEACAALLDRFSTASGHDLAHLGTAAGAQEIQDTARLQPLLVAAALATAAALPVEEAAVVAGHSVGELTAAALAKVVTPTAAVTLAATRGREMAAACALEPTGMSAVLGGDRAEVLARLEEFGLTPANRNGAGQVVAAGSVVGLEKLAAHPPAGSRVVTLKVAGAFHTAYMAPAREALGAAVAATDARDPLRMLLSNADGTVVGTGREALDRLVAQVTAPVRWDLCQASLADLGVTAAIELTPAGTLAGLARRALKGVEVVTVNTPGDLPAARELAARHAGHAGAEPTVGFSIAVAGAAGSFAPADLAEGDDLPAGASVGDVATRQGTVPVTTVHGGVLAEWLVAPGDPVAVGQPVARLHPAGVAA